MIRLRKPLSRSLWFACGIVWLCATAIPPATNADDAPTFYRGINLNGPALVIDEHPWEAGNARGVSADELSAFENQDVRLIPATDVARSRMIRSSRWSPSGKARVRVTDVPAGTYSVYLYVWEDNDPQTFEIHLGGKQVVKAYNSGNGGHWDRLGPWVIDVKEGTIELAAIGGHANLSGIEIWRGELTNKHNPLRGVATVATSRSRETDVAVVLARNCLECHNASDRKGGLDLTRREKALAGADSGQVLKPGDLDSLLVKRIESGEMPPKGRDRLSADDRKLLRDWVKDGAIWAADPIDPFLYTSARRAGYNWWSLQPLRIVEPPPVQRIRSVSEGGAGQTLNPIDNFILHRLEKAGLKPSTEADRRTLIRRLTFDLIGLPPTPDEVEEFVNDRDPRAYEKLVDRLLDSPHYGERWARHWLDIVRFGESQGFERNKLRPSLWKYRDFVVEAFNSDLPYDDFIRWQIAGDVLQPEDPLAVIASGFLAIGPYDLTAYTNGTPDMQKFAREEELEELVGAVGQTFLGLTINCSRCHDHKFDPITQREFYQISAALGGTYHGDERESLADSAKPTVERRVSALEAEVEGINARAERADERMKRELAAQRSRRDAIRQLLTGGPVHTTVPKQPGAWHVLARGDFKQPGEVVVSRGIAAVTGTTADWKLADNAPEANRRKALAEWIADPNNPLTPRVIVNRLWGYHFGEGLVRTTSDFGFQGGLPSHPELLDWLAGQLVRPADGPVWSLKRIQRLIVTSATYRQSSRTVPKAAEVDADNRLVWKRPSQRLEAETFRDAVLAVSGDLDLKLGGPGFRDF
ncbi:MAG: PSD1 domain-containing protein, partial [Planctomycetaceae bacterium]|nr:PSD1 domain-containing protein [Planctomycetaceae bacterium]